MKNPLFRIPIKYGLVGAALVMVLITGLFYAERHPMLIPIIFDYRIILFTLFIFFSIREFRDYFNDGILHFWQGMASGLLCYMTIAFIGAIYILFFGSFEDQFLEIYLKEATSQLVENKDAFIESISEEVYDNTLKELPFTTVTDLAVDYFLKSMPIGLFLTIIIAVILRRQPKS